MYRDSLRVCDVFPKLGDVGNPTIRIMEAACARAVLRFVVFWTLGWLGTLYQHSHGSI